MASKRSLLDLLPPPTQRDPKGTAKRPRRGEDEDTKAVESAAEQRHGDNEQYRVTQTAAPEIAVAPIPPPSVPEEPVKDKEPEVDAEELIMRALAAEQTRAKKGNRAAAEVEFKEISQDSLKGGVSTVQREVDAIGLALKADADEEDKVVLPEYTLSKEARKKHQITTLYQTMKQNETKLLTKEAQNAKTKRETERKYGWR